MERPLTSTRTRVRRLPEKAVGDAAVCDAVLDSSRVAHVAVLDAGTPFVLPVAFGRDGDRVLIHGSTASRLFRILATGAPTCLTVTTLDGLVIARSAFESSMHYRSVMVLGSCTSLQGDEKLSALHALTEHLMPGRWADVRPPLGRELAASLVLALPLDEWSVKVSDSPPDDAVEDLDGPAWAGVLPIRTTFGDPQDAPDLGPGRTPPRYLANWKP